MTKRAFEKIKAGLDDARAFLEGTADKRRYRVHTPASKPTRDDMRRASKSHRPGLRSTGGKPGQRGG